MEPRPPLQAGIWCAARLGPGMCEISVVLYVATSGAPCKTSLGADTATELTGAQTAGVVPAPDSGERLSAVRDRGRHAVCASVLPNTSGATGTPSGASGANTMGTMSYPTQKNVQKMPLCGRDSPRELRIGFGSRTYGERLFLALCLMRNRSSLPASTGLGIWVSKPASRAAILSSA